ncbi:Uncharacterised protein [Vibrio cholerae]|nr:Uncharacterised protein [Vibrio cholerae]
MATLLLSQHLVRRSKALCNFSGENLLRLFINHFVIV